MGLFIQNSNETKQMMNFENSNSTQQNITTSSTTTTTTTTTTNEVATEEEAARTHRAEQMATALVDSLSNTISLYETRMRSVQESQLLFSNQLDCLDQELRLCATLAQLPPLESHVKQLSDARRKLHSINGEITLISDRLKRINDRVQAS